MAELAVGSISPEVVGDDGARRSYPAARVSIFGLQRKRERGENAPQGRGGQGQCRGVLIRARGAGRRWQRPSAATDTQLLPLAGKT